MKFKIDENLPHECLLPFRAAGHAVDSVIEEGLSGAEDEALSNRCRTESRIIITLDLDFADIRAYPPGSHPGIIVLRPSLQDKHSLVSLINRLLGVHSWPTARWSTMGS